jgi:hypothetical protein
MSTQLRQLSHHATEGRPPRFPGNACRRGVDDLAAPAVLKHDCRKVRFPSLLIACRLPQAGKPRGCEALRIDAVDQALIVKSVGRRPATATEPCHGQRDGAVSRVSWWDRSVTIASLR